MSSTSPRLLLAVLGPSAISSAATDQRTPATAQSRGFSLYDSFVVVAAFALGFAAIGRERFDSHWHIGTFVTFGCLAAVGLCGEAWRLFRALRTASLSSVGVATFRLYITRNVGLALLLSAGCVSLLVPWSDGYPVRWGGNAWQADFDFVWWLTAIAVLGMSRLHCSTDVTTARRTSKLFGAFRLGVNAFTWLAAGLLLAIVLTEMTTLHWAVAQSQTTAGAEMPRTVDPHAPPASLDFIAQGATVWSLALVGGLAALAMIVAARRGAGGWRWVWWVAMLLALTCVTANVGYALPKFAPLVLGHWDTPWLAWLWGMATLMLFAGVVAGRFESGSIDEDGELPIPPPLRLAAFHRLLWVAMLLAAGAVGQAFTWHEPFSWQTLANACFPETMLQLAVILIVAQRLIALCLRRPRPAVLSPVAPMRLLRTWLAVLWATVLAIPSLAILGLMLWTLPWYVWRYWPSLYEAIRHGW